MTVTTTADNLYNALIDTLRVNRNYLSIKGGNVAKAAAIYEVKSTHDALEHLLLQLDRYKRAYDMLQDQLVDWERDLDNLRDVVNALEGKDEQRDDIGDVLDWVDKANDLYRPRWRG